jgi:hypothetical protein
MPDEMLPGWGFPLLARGATTNHRTDRRCCLCSGTIARAERMALVVLGDAGSSGQWAHLPCVAEAR